MFISGLVVAPLVNPAALDHFQMAFVAFFGFAGEIGNFQHPLMQVGKADAVNFPFIEIIAEALVKFHGDILVIVPVYGGFECHAGGIMVLLRVLQATTRIGF